MSLTLTFTKTLKWCFCGVQSLLHHHIPKTLHLFTLRSLKTKLRQYTRYPSMIQQPLSSVKQSSVLVALKIFYNVMVHNNIPATWGFLVTTAKSYFAIVKSE